MDQRLVDELAWERRARKLLQRIALATAEVSTVDDALRLALGEICAQTGWPVGHVLRRADDGAMVSAGIWHLADPERFHTFREVSEKSRFPPGIGLPGRVLATGTPAWIVDVSLDTNFPRNRMASDLQVTAAFGLPVLVEGKVFAVLEFFTPSTVEPDVPLLDVMAAIGAQLGRVVERSRADGAIRLSELSYRSVAQTAHDAIISANASGHVIAWNFAAAKLFGYSEEEALGKPLTIVIPERLHAQHDQGVARVRGGGEQRVIGKTVELPGRRKDGTEFPLELSLATWTIEGARFFTGIIRDITQRKLNEERLRGLAEKLAESERKATEASRAKSDFLANMSHELRTPLNAILGFVHLMERDRTLNPAQRENVSIILRSGEHLLGLINDVLSISKIEAGRITFNPVALDLGGMLRGLRDMFQARAQNKGLALAGVVGPLPDRVRGDEGKLRQVLINLLGNAIKFTDQGEVTLQVAWADGQATFAVADTGRGIAPEELGTLCEPFAQGAAGRDAGEGTGLGLTISREFVRVMQGDIGIESTVGKGSRFTFTIPLPMADGGSLPRPVSERRVAGLAPGQVPPRLLVVDNDADNRTLLSRVLSLAGMVVREAGDGAEGLAIWTEWRPQVVFMDMRMPVVNGYETTRNIRAAETRAHDGRPRTVVIACTASVFEHDRPQIHTAGCDHILDKPFQESRVFEALARYVGVEFVYEEPEDETPEAVAAPRALDPADLRPVPGASLAELRQAVTAGDDLDAQRVIDGLPQGNEALARELTRMVRGFRFDELLDIIDRVQA